MAQVANKQIFEDPSQTLGYFNNIELFSNLSDKEIACFKLASQSRLYKKDKIIYLQEDAADYFYIICSGWVKLFHTMPEGEEVIVDMLTTGQMFGESAIFVHDLHMCGAQIIGDAQILSVPSSVLREQISINPALAVNMLRSLSQHHRRHYGELALNAMLNAPQRIGCFLLRLCPKHKNKNIAFDLPYDKSLIADTLGMKGATFSRALNALRKETGIRIIDQRIEIDSVELLADFVYGPNSVKYISGKIPLS